MKATIVGLLVLAASYASAQPLPCQMDPKFKRASCDDPAYQAAAKAYNACAKQHARVAAGYTCVPRSVTWCGKFIEQCPIDPGVADAPWDVYRAASQQYFACAAATVPKSCAVPGFPPHKGKEPPPAN